MALQYVDLPEVDDSLQTLGNEGWHWWPSWGGVVRRLDNRRYVAVVPFLFTHGIIWGWVKCAWSYEDRWCYGHAKDAVAAAWAWDGVGDPMGWHRHLNTGRRRENGDPNREEVRW